MLAHAAFLTFVVFLQAPLTLFANGGAFYSSVVERTGNLVPMEKPLISLEAETIDAYIHGDDVGVYVTYLLANHGPADSVTSGFPVDLATPETLYTPNGYDYVLGGSLSDFRVEDGGHPVTVEKVITKPLSAAERPAGIDSQIQLVRRWSLMRLRFEAGKKKHLTVTIKWPAWRGTKALKETRSGSMASVPFATLFIRPPLGVMDGSAFSMLP